MLNENGWQVFQGDALMRLRELKGAGLSAIISDPPYASGGMSMSEKSRSTRACCKPGAVCALFVDWRQLPALTDAIQWAGWVWRGIAVWDKMNSRPQLGRFRQQCEYIVWGSNGPLPVERGIGVLPGLFSYPNVPPQERWHQTQKPLELMKQVVQLCEPGGVVCDPFAGSGSTLQAALEMGYQAVGIELGERNVAIIRKRLAGIQQRMDTPGTSQQIALF